MEYYEHIASTDVREYLRRIRPAFSDFEKAAILYMAIPEQERRQKVLRDFAETTTNSVLKRQIAERLDYENWLLEKFAENPDGAYCYELCWHSGDSDAYTSEKISYNVWLTCDDLHFSSMEAAVACGRASRCRFSVNKRKLLKDSCADLSFEQVLQENAELMRASYFRNGKLRRIIEVTENGAEKAADCSGSLNALLMGTDEQRFEECRVDIPHPFRRGDLVKVTGYENLLERTGEYYVVDLPLREVSDISNSTDRFAPADMSGRDEPSHLADELTVDGESESNDNRHLSDDSMAIDTSTGIDNINSMRRPKPIDTSERNVILNCIRMEQEFDGVHIPVVGVTPDGECSCSHVSLLYLERIEPGEMETDAEAQQLLALSRLLKGNGSISEVKRYFDAFSADHWEDFCYYSRGGG